MSAMSLGAGGDLQLRMTWKDIENLVTIKYRVVDHKRSGSVLGKDAAEKARFGNDGTILKII